MRRLSWLGLVASGLTLQLVCPLETVACSIAWTPWQERAVWPRPDASVPLNVRIQVRIPEEELWKPRLEPPRVTTRGGSLLPNRLDEPPIHYERALSVFAVTADGTLGDEVALERRMLSSGDWRFELAPRALLRPESRYVVVWQNKTGGRERLGEVHTGTQADHTPPNWEGIRTARFAPPNAVSFNYSLCPPVSSGQHGPRAIVQVHPPHDDSELPLQYLVWVQKGVSRIDYTIPPHRPLFAQKDLLTIEDIPWLVAHIRVGIRALDAAGNLSPPSEIDVEIKRGPCDASERGCP
jgi:hypothetical protein